MTGSPFPTDPCTCQKCLKPVYEISCATSAEYAYHPDCRPWNTAARERDLKKQEFFADQKAKRLALNQEANP